MCVCVCVSVYMCMCACFPAICVCEEEEEKTPWHRVSLLNVFPPTAQTLNATQRHMSVLEAFDAELKDTRVTSVEELKRLGSSISKANYKSDLR